MIEGILLEILQDLLFVGIPWRHTNEMSKMPI